MTDVVAVEHVGEAPAPHQLALRAHRDRRLARARETREPDRRAALPTLPALLTQITQYDIDRFNAALLTVAPGAPATATVDFYDRSGAVIQSITFDAS